jgi:hypothetical protein
MANRMIVLPEEVYEGLVNKGSVLQDSLDNQLLRKSGDLTKTIHSHGAPSDRHFTHADQQLKQILRLLKHRRERAADTSMLEGAIQSGLEKFAKNAAPALPPRPPPPPPPPARRGYHRRQNVFLHQFHLVHYRRYRLHRLHLHHRRRLLHHRSARTTLTM